MKHSLYDTWKNIMARCYNQNDSRYKYYGAKGIVVEKQWHTLENFIEDVNNHLLNGHLLYEAEYQLDKDIKGGNIYSLENCTVVTGEQNREEKLKKQRKKIKATNDSEAIIFDSMAETADKLNIPQQTLYRYLKSGKQHSSGFIFKYFV